MIINFKIYENRKTEPKFNVGDNVYCTIPITFIFDKEDNLKRNIKYQVTSIFQDGIGDWLCYLKNKKPKYHCYRFITEMEYIANQYNI